MRDRKTARAIHSMLSQDELWIEATGREWRVEDLEAQHRENIIGFLERNAETLEFYFFYGLTLLYSSRHVNGEMAEVLMDQEHDRIMGEEMIPAMHGPVAWMRDTPLVSRLLELQAEWEAEGSFV